MAYLRKGGRVRSAILTVMTFAFVLAGSAVDAGPRKKSGGSVGQPSKFASIVVDAKSGRVLQATNADAPRFPASLTKIMTAYVLFEEISAGRMSMTTPFQVSARCAAMAPSKLGLRTGSTISARDAMFAIITKSANDAACTIGENISGSESAFAARMTRTARRIGMSRTSFGNASGLPNPNNQTTARDMATLGRAIQERFPALYANFNTRSFAYKGRRYGNHNRLLGRVRGVDGIKTGYTRASGFNLVTSAKADGRHIVAVVLGGSSGRARDNHMAGLVAAHLPRGTTGPVTDRVMARAADGPAEERVAAVAAAPAPAAAERRPAPVAIERPVTAQAASIKLPPATIAAAAVPTARPQLPPIEAAGVDRITTASVPMPRERGATAARMAAAAAASAPAPAERRQTVAATTTVPKGAWVIQLGAFDNDAAARAKLSRVQDRAKRVVADASAFTEPVNVNGGTLFRARFGGFDTVNDARAACSALKRMDFACVPMKP